MEPLPNMGFHESPTKTGSAKVVPRHFRNGTALELAGTGLELSPDNVELSPEQNVEKGAELVGIANVLDQMPSHMKGDKAAEYFPWSWKHVRSNIIPRIAEGLRIPRSILFDRGTLTEEGIHLLASYEQCCANKISIFVGGKRVEVRQREDSDIPQAFDDWIQAMLKERRQAAQQIPPINPSTPNSSDYNSSSALAVGGADFNIDAFVDEQLRQMGGVEESVIATLEEVEAELVEADQGFESLNESTRQVKARQTAAQAVQDAAADAKLYSATYKAARRRIEATRTQAQQPGKSQAGQSQAT